MKVEGNGEKVGQLNFPLQTTSNNLPIGVSNLTYIQPFLFYKPLFQASKTYHSEQEKRRLKRSKGRGRLFNSNDFYFDEKASSCHCPAGKAMWLSLKQVETAGRQYVRFSGYLKDCRKKIEDTRTLTEF